MMPAPASNPVARRPDARADFVNLGLSNPAHISRHPRQGLRDAMSQTALIDLTDISVMCIDDDPVIRSVVRFALQRHGCRDVVQAHGGVEALDLCAGREFDLVICDFHMSPMTGLEFLRELAKTGLGEGWPVIMLSAETDPQVIHEAQELGVSAWVGKPLSAQTLVDRVTAVLRKRGLSNSSAEDPEFRAVAERHHARLMAALRAAEEAVRGVDIRPREAVLLAQGLRHMLDDITEHAGTLGYGLVIMLAARATDLVVAMARNPAVTVRGHTTISRTLGALVTAMKRVAHNRMTGDGAEAGLKLLSAMDGMIAPVRASLH
jgi:two-component system chemotaxis response regulator CheY